MANEFGQPFEPEPEDPRVADLRAQLAEAQARAAMYREALEKSLDGNRHSPCRDLLGTLVRTAWVRWAKQQDSPKAHWLLPYDQLSEADKEADRQIGESMFRWAMVFDSSARCMAVDALTAAPSDWLDQRLKAARQEGYCGAVESIASTAFNVDDINIEAVEGDVEDTLALYRDAVRVAARQDAARECKKIAREWWHESQSISALEYRLNKHFDLEAPDECS